MTDGSEHEHEHDHVVGVRRRISGAIFGVLFCTWVFTAVAGMGVVAVSSLNLIASDGASADDTGTHNRPTARTSAATLAFGVLMIVWPLPFCRRSPSGREVDGFGRGW